MNSKVKVTRRHKTYPYLLHDKSEDVVVTVGKLLLVQCKQEDSEFKRIHPNKLTGFGVGDYLDWTPIIISETEKIEVGDWVIYGNAKRSNHLLKEVEDQRAADHYNEMGRMMDDIRRKAPTVTVWSAKVLALPEKFSDKQLQAIIDNKLKDQEEFMIECTGHEYNGYVYEFPIKSPLTLYPIAAPKISFDQFNSIADLRTFLLNHPDKEMVKAACLHYLGDKFQAFAEKNEQMYGEEMVKVAFFCNPKSFVGIIGDRSDETAWEEFKKKNLIKGRHGN